MKTKMLALYLLPLLLCIGSSRVSADRPIRDFLTKIFSNFAFSAVAGKDTSIFPVPQKPTSPLNLLTSFHPLQAFIGKVKEISQQVISSKDLVAGSSNVLTWLVNVPLKGIQKVLPPPLDVIFGILVLPLHLLAIIYSRLKGFALYLLHGFQTVSQYFQARYKYRLRLFAFRIIDWLQPGLLNKIDALIPSILVRLRLYMERVKFARLAPKVPL